MRFVVTLTLAACGAAALGADEGMWRIDQLPLEVIASKYGVRLAPSDLERLQSAPVRLVSGGGGGTGTFASANGLILTNHHVALDCIRTSTLAEQNKARADNLIDSGFTAKSPADELPCKRFKAQIESSARDVTAEVNRGVTPGMPIAEIQRVRQAARSDIERACQSERGDRFSCDVVDFNSGARLLLITYEDFRDVRLVYAPEKQLGYFGGDEMNFRFPRYVSDISILRAYQGTDGNHDEYDASHVPVKPGRYLRVTTSGVKEGDFTLVAGNPGNTNRYRESYSAEYNLRKGIPTQIEDLELQLGLLRKYAAMKPEYQVLLQSQIFGLANTLKYQKDVLAALKATNVVAERQRRERELTMFLGARPDLKAEFGGVLAAQADVYANDVPPTRISMRRSAGCSGRMSSATASACTSSRSSGPNRPTASASRSSRNATGRTSDRGCSTTIRSSPPSTRRCWPRDSNGRSPCRRRNGFRRSRSWPRKWDRRRLPDPWPTR